MTTALSKLSDPMSDEIADRYRQQGYRVLVKPRVAPLTEFISRADLDDIIHAEKTAVIVALKPPEITPEVKDVSDRVASSQTIGEQIPTLYDYPVRDLTDISIYLSRAGDIIAKGDFDAAVCGAVFIAKVVMRMIAEHHSIDFETQSPTELALTFFACSFLTQSDYEILVKAIEISDRVIEQQEKVAVAQNFADQAFEVVQYLVRFHSQV
ncbi:MAG: hypothetical protein GDA56_05065 [Hormoscilla sp. GM7CHS1pb]|nr:hypothetical protein [Hormoscilla sp. GM7CHS1pb]